MMSTAIPQFVDETIREWDFIAFFAYDGFEASGRGVVGLSKDSEGTKALYGPRDYFDRENNQRVLQMLDDYNPESEFLVHFNATGGTRTIRIKTPDGGRNPKRVWFFEMLRRVQDEPETLPETLPDWFVSLCDKMAGTENENSRTSQST